MATAVDYPHLVVRADGAVQIEGTRYKVLHLAGEHYQYGWTAEELLRQHPDLRPEQVYAAMTYIYDHYDELVQGLMASATAADLHRPPQAVSRDELLRRVGN